MTAKPARSTVAAAAARLRAMSLAGEPGTILGSEDTLVTTLGGARATVRQAARLLEREGLLKVRRGMNGGYFAARPNVGTIETAVSAYLDTLDMDVEDVGVISSLLWVEMLRRAAGLGTDAARATAESFRERVMSVRPDTPFARISLVEDEWRNAIFELTQARYIELIIQINYAFSQRRFAVSENVDPEAHQIFVRAWRNAKLMEIEAIAAGDPELGALAARHMCRLWHQRIWGTPDVPPDQRTRNFADAVL